MAEGMPDPAGEPGTVDTDNAAKRPAWVWWTVGGVALLVVLAVVFFMSGSTSVPDMVGMTSEDATAALTSAGLRVGAVSEVETLSAPPGVVVAQSPIAGEDVRKESTVNLAVTSVPVVTVPDLVGKSVSEANAELAIEGLRAGEVEHVFDDEVEAGQVTAQDPEAGTEVKVADSVDVTVSKGTEQGQVPN
ncbi:MAG TPA: PASTA domain-containing protein, partial [Coriobacteriia bacterium]|nr:PASTA domain-containing protein [Coriobacteriia bacterium]